MPPPRSAPTAAPASSAGSDSDASDDAAHVAAETALFESFSAVPSCAGASLVRDPRDPTAAPTLHVVTSQRDLAANRSRRSVAVLPLPSRAPNPGDHLNHPAFGVEERGALLTSVSPSGARRLVVRSGKDAGGDRDGVSLEIWEGGALVSEVLVPPKTHGTLCGDGTFGGVDWSAREGRVVYVAEAPRDGPTPEWGMGVTKTALEASGQDLGEDASTASSSKNKKSWKGQGEWREEWGEQLVGRVEPSAFVLDVATGTVTRVAGLPADAVAASGPVWAPPTRPGEESDAVVCPVWLGDIHNFKSTSRRLGLVFCFNRPSALFLAKAPISEPTATPPDSAPATRITENASSAMWPRFTPDGKTLAFVSHERAVESGAHFATASLRAMSWSADGPGEERVVVPVVDVPERRGAFPGVYASSPPPAEPWLTREDGSGVDMVLQTTWGAGEAIVRVNLETGATSRITPPAAVGEGAWIGDGNPDAENDADVERGGGGSWALCDVRDGVVAAIRSSPGSVPEARVAWFRKPLEDEPFRGWTRVKSAYAGAAAKPAMDAIASLEYDVATVSRECVAGDGGDENPDAPATVQSIVVRARTERDDADEVPTPKPLIVLPHGGPHASCAAGYVATVAYLASLGYAVAYCNYRGSTGYGEKALQTLVGGAAGVADVADCAAIARRAIDDKVADPDRVCVVGGSHGGFLGAHLIGQHPEMFKCAVLRNPVTDVASMVHLTDIPDWCYVETVGKDAYADLPSLETLAAMRAASPVAHVDAVRAPVLVLLGAVDLRVPPTNGLRYAAALRERGGDCRVRVFPEDAHGLVNPRTEFESFVTVAAFLREHMGAPR